MERLIFDTHSHYMDDAFAEDRDAVLQALPEGGVALAMLASVDAADSEQNLKLTEQYDYLLGSVGIHPENLPEHPAEELERIAALVAHKNCYAIGEIGLDFTMKAMTRKHRLRFFRNKLPWRKSWICRLSFIFEMQQQMLCKF